jgi:hypothetical protein
VRVAQQRAHARDGMKCAGNVAPPLFRCQPRLRHRCACTHEYIIPHRRAPVMRECVCETRALVEPTLPLPHPCQWNGYECVSFPDDVVRPRKARHASRHRLGEGRPAAILQRVHQRPTGSGVDPAHRSTTAHVRRQKITPLAPARAQWMPAPFAARRRQRDDSIPAPRTCQAPIATIVQPTTNDARAWEKEIQRRVSPTAPRPAAEYHRPDAAASASRMTSRGAAMPNHHSNASAPCSSNMQKPSSAAWPCSLAALTHAVSPAR